MIYKKRKSRSLERLHTNCETEEDLEFTVWFLNLLFGAITGAGTEDFK